MNFNSYNSSGFVPYSMDENDGSGVIGNASMMEFEPAPISHGGRNVHIVSAIHHLPQSLTHHCDDFLALFSKAQQQQHFIQSNVMSNVGQSTGLDFPLDFEPEPLTNLRDDSQNSSMGYSSRQLGTPSFTNPSPQPSVSSFQGSNVFMQQNQHGMNSMTTWMMGNPSFSSGRQDTIDLLDDF